MPTSRSDEKDVEVSLFINVISRVNYAPGYVDSLFTLLFLYCALQAQISCQRLTDTFTSHYVRCKLWQV